MANSPVHSGTGGDKTEFQPIRIAATMPNTRTALSLARCHEDHCVPDMGTNDVRCQHVQQAGGELAPRNARKGQIENVDVDLGTRRVARSRKDNPRTPRTASSDKA